MQKRRGRPPLSPEEKIRRQEQKEEQIGYNLLLPVQLHERLNTKIFDSGISKKETMERLIQVYLHGVYGTVPKETRDAFYEKVQKSGQTVSQAIEKSLKLYLSEDAS
ncbi:MAG: hypothetical protein OCD01_15585 [Fibrobacterales bacterium]